MSMFVYFLAEINECMSKPCINGGRCIDKLLNYSCSCAVGYTGRNCEIGMCMTFLEIYLTCPVHIFLRNYNLFFLLSISYYIFLFWVLMRKTSKEKLSLLHRITTTILDALTLESSWTLLPFLLVQWLVEQISVRVVTACPLLLSSIDWLGEGGRRFEQMLFHSFI